MPAVEWMDLHAHTLHVAANDVDEGPVPARLPSAWQRRREAASLVVLLALRARGVSAGMCARWWEESARAALARLHGQKPLCVEHLQALPDAARRAVLDALARAA